MQKYKGFILKRSAMFGWDIIRRADGKNAGWASSINECKLLIDYGKVK